MEVAVIGAGVAGCAAAAALARAGVSVTLLDKGRLAGGRLASKRLETPAGPVEGAIGAQYAACDMPAHGAPDAGGNGFSARIRALARAGRAAPWAPSGLDPGSPRFVGVPDMRALVSDLPGGVQLCTGARVERLVPCGGRRGWRLLGAGAAEGPFDAVLVTAPAPQTAALLSGPAPALAARAAEARLTPCWSALLWFPVRIEPGFDAARTGHPAAAWIAREGARPGRRLPGDLWVVQAGPEWSAAHLEEPEARAGEALARAFAEASGHPQPPEALRAHRWRYALVARPLGVPALLAPELGLATAGDWHIGGGLAAAFRSGEDAARRLLETLG